MGFKHTGLFPEHAYNWNMLIKKIKEAKRDVSLYKYYGGNFHKCFHGESFLRVM